MNNKDININDKNYFYSNKEIQYEINKFINPEREFNWKYSIQNSYHFKYDIERVWEIIKNYDILSTLTEQNHSTCIYLKGKNTHELENEFKGRIFGYIDYVAKVNSVINLPEIKKIEWIFYTKGKNYFIIEIELFKVTDDNSAVVIKKFKFENELMKQEAEKSNYKIVDKKLFEEIENLIKNERINILKYESAIINGKMEDIWDIITDYKKIAAIAPNNNYLPNINLRDLKIGEKIEASIFHENNLKTINVLLKYKEEKPGWNKWLIVCEVNGVYPFKMPKHIAAFQLTKISNNECQLTLLTKFLENVENEEFNKIVEKKKYLLLSIKDYFDNFYSPSN